MANQPATEIELDDAREILVDAVKVNTDLSIALTNYWGEQVVKSNDETLLTFMTGNFFRKLGWKRKLYLMFFLQRLQVI